MAKKRKNPRLILVESTEAEDAIRAKIGDKKVVTVDLWVRTPDSEKLEEMTVAARLCGCRRICLAVVEDQL
jgi:hypothetical protein